MASTRNPGCRTAGTGATADGMGDERPELQAGREEPIDEHIAYTFRHDLIAREIGKGDHRNGLDAAEIHIWVPVDVRNLGHAHLRGNGNIEEGGDRETK